MKNTTKRSYIIIFLICAFFIGLGIMLGDFIMNGDSWITKRTNKHIYASGELKVAGTVYDRKGQALASSENGQRVYNDNWYIRVSTLHAVGDSGGYISTSVQNLYRANLIGYNFVNGIYDTLSSDKGCDVRLTLDADVCADTYYAMNGNKGTVLIYNYKTGEIMCMVSSPTYDPANKPDNIDSDTTGKYDAVYLNRALSGVFTPGSTFKVVTAIAAINNIPDIYSKTFTCNGKVAIDGGEVRCNGVHGEISFEKALNVSCNSAFALIANEVGKEALTQTVRDLGFSKNITVSRAKTVKSTFDLSEASPVDLGWAGIGQYTTLVNPTQMLLLMGAIANNGTAMTPYLVEESAEIVTIKSVESTNVNMEPEVASQMKKLLRSNVVNHYGDNKFPNLEVAGKTGSAEVAGKRSHAWFVGFSQRSDFPYAFVVCLENGGTGYDNAIPVANKALQSLAENLGIDL